MILVAIKTASAALSPTPPLKKARSARTTQHQPTPDRNIGERPLRARSGLSRDVQEVVLKGALLGCDRGVGDADDDVV
jgi:hypothetical protein